MTKECAKNLGEIIKFWGNGGNIWYYNSKEWVKSNSYNIPFDSTNIEYIIEDEFFEARKSYFLGKPIEFKRKNNKSLRNKWKRLITNKPIWDKNYIYREAKFSNNEDIDWFHINDNHNKVIMVRDNQDEKWVPAIFLKYDAINLYPFCCTNKDWRYARLLVDDDIADIL